MPTNAASDADRPVQRHLEDRLGMLAMLLLFGWLTSISLRDMVVMIEHHQPGSPWLVSVIARLANLVFLGLIVWFTATRLPARNLSQSVVPKVVAILGTLVMMLTAVLPSGQIGALQQVVAAILSVVGLILSSICLFRLGRSFAIAPAARRLVTTGPYAIVRHPLYAAELIAISGAVLGSGSWSVAGVGVIWLGLQIARARFEEQVLSQTFPEYGDYAARVPMLVPGLHVVAPGGLSRQPV